MPKIKNTTSPSMNRPEFEQWFAETVRPVEMEYMERVFANASDPESVQLMTAWEDYVDGELKEEYWIDFQNIDAAQHANEKERNKRLEQSLERLSVNIHESALQVLGSFADKPEAICVYFLNQRQMRQREIAKKLGISLGKVSGIINEIEQAMDVRMVRYNKKQEVLPKSIDPDYYD